MIVTEKIAQLQQILFETLSPIITGDYWIFDMPHFSNVGDMLIFQGELDFCRKFSARCKGIASSTDLQFPRVKAGDLILFNGGGNFGDIWPRAHRYRMEVMRRNPSCRFLVFPQTVYYSNADVLREDAAFFKDYDCTVCVRDLRSYELLRSTFSNKVLLLPDMAFCMDMKPWISGKPMGSKEEALILKRTDVEYKPHPALNEMMQNDADLYDVQDWRAMTEKNKVEKISRSLAKRRKGFGGIYSWYMFHIYRKWLISSGIRQLAPYCAVHTTRLHACILSILLQKEEIHLYDNSYGKNSGFYEAWLQDLECVTYH